MNRRLFKLISLTKRYFQTTRLNPPALRRLRLLPALAAIVAMFMGPASLWSDATLDLGSSSKSSGLSLFAPLTKAGPNGGISLQYVFYPQYSHDGEPETAIKRVSDVYALFLDKWGNTREDSNGNQILDHATGTENEKNSALQGDMIIRFVRGSGDGRTLTQKGRDEKGRNEVYIWETSEKNAKPLWSLAELLGLFTDEQIVGSRAYTAPVIKEGEKLSGSRRIYTLYDKQRPHNGNAFGGTPWLELFNAEAAPYLEPLMAGPTALSSPIAFTGPQNKKFYLTAFGQAEALSVFVSIIKADESVSSPVSLKATSNNSRLLVAISIKPGSGTAREIVRAIENSSSASMPGLMASLAPGDEGLWVPEYVDSRLIAQSPSFSADLINYTLGKDAVGWRNRSARAPWSIKKQTWRLGELGDSKPVIVGTPSARYHVLYGDRSYQLFQKEKAQRRQMAYFGSGDGIFHAVNLGFYRPLKNGAAAYCPTPSAPAEAAAHALGAEVWGFLPPSLLPELQGLAEPRDMDAGISYLPPLIADAKNSQGNNQWRTIVIGGVRISAKNGPAATAPRPGRSEFFAFDITEPEKEPLLLWTFEQPDVGFSQSQPAIVSSQGRWYALISGGSKPANKNQNAKIFVLDAFSGKLERTLDSGLPQSSFTSAFTPIAPDYLVRDENSDSTVWATPLVYFGSISAQENGKEKGAVYRLQMIDTGDSGTPKALDVKDWRLNVLFNSPQPISGAVNSAFDANGNRWVIFGSGGRMAAPGERNYLYGLKEPLNENGFLDFKELPDHELLDLSGVEVYEDGSLKGLAGHRNYQDLYNAMLEHKPESVKGYKRAISVTLPENGGDIPAALLHQPKIDLLDNGRSILVFTSYAPSSKGASYLDGWSGLNMADTFTGLPAPHFKDFSGQLTAGKKLADGLEPIYQLSGYVYAGRGMASETVIIKTDRGTIIRNISPKGADNSIFIDPGISFSSTTVSWQEVLDMGFVISDEELAAGIDFLN